MNYQIDVMSAEILNLKSVGRFLLKSAFLMEESSFSAHYQIILGGPLL